MLEIDDCEQMEEGEIIAEIPVTVAGLTIVPVERTSTNWVSHGSYFAFWASKQPVGIIIASAGTHKALQINGEEISLEELIEKVPSMQDVLDSLNSGA